jgi:hypothetical protein
LVLAAACFFDCALMAVCAMKSQTGQSCRCYRIASQLRRCLYYLLVSIPLLAGVGIWVHHFVGQPNGARPFAALVVFFILELACAVPLTWKVCVNEHGISRRLVIWWDEWTWDQFASGTIDKQSGYAFRDSTRPWWRRKLRLGFVDIHERAALIAQINRQYRLPPFPELPESITVKYGLWRSTTFDANGIQHTIRSQPREYLWSDVHRVRITRLEPLRRDFEVLQVFLPDEELKLQIVQHQGGRSPTWRGPEAEVITEFLRQHLPENRVDVDLVGERPTRREDVEALLADERKQSKQLYWCLRICAALLVPAFAWMAIDEGLLRAAIVAAWYSIICVPVSWSVIQIRRRRILQLEAWL